MRRGLGDGRGVDFWHHHWIGQRPLKLNFENFFTGFPNQKVLLVDLVVWRVLLALELVLVCEY